MAFIHERHDPLFGGWSPAPNLEALRLLRTQVVEGHYDLGLATDGDADRIAIVDERGKYITVNDILLLLYWYMHEVRAANGVASCVIWQRHTCWIGWRIVSAKHATRPRSASSTSRLAWWPITHCSAVSRPVA